MNIGEPEVVIITPRPEPIRIPIRKEPEREPVPVRRTPEPVKREREAPSWGGSLKARELLYECPVCGGDLEVEVLGDRITQSCPRDGSLVI